MFKVSQDIYLNSSDAITRNGSCGTHQGLSNSEINGNQTSNSSLTSINKVQILNLPRQSINSKTSLNLTINKNGVDGNYDMQLESPHGTFTIIPLKILDSERFEFRIPTLTQGQHKLHITCNSNPVPGSPFPLIVNDEQEGKFPVFNSDAKQVICSGAGLERINLSEKNEFLVDAANAGNNILFIGICGPKGQCDEVSIKHIGGNKYNVTYQVQDAGEYLIAAKWGDDHVPGSPFHLRTI